MRYNLNADKEKKEQERARTFDIMPLSNGGYISIYKSTIYYDYLICHKIDKVNNITVPQDFNCLVDDYFVRKNLEEPMKELDLVKNNTVYIMPAARAENGKIRFEWVTDKHYGESCGSILSPDDKNLLISLMTAEIEDFKTRLNEVVTKGELITGTALVRVITHPDAHRSDCDDEDIVTIDYLSDYLEEIL